MPPENWAKIISVSMVPVVLISACGLLGLAFYNRLAMTVSRLREFHRERLREQENYARSRGSKPDPIATERHQRLIGMLEIQTSRVNRRARLLRLNVMCLLATIACLVVSSLCLGVSIIWATAGYLAMGLFFLGLIVLLVAVILAMLEIRLALQPVELEDEFIKQLGARLEGQLNGREEPEVPARPPGA